MLYPLKFKPLYKNYIWGGRNLELLGKQLPAGEKVAESWEVACHKNGSSVIANGEFEGISLPDLVRSFGRKVIGNSLPQKDIDTFPLLVKFIDAESNLSVQVHPDDSYARAHENGESGKNEMWYIIRANPGARIINGVIPGTTRERFAAAIEENRVESCLNSISVRAGDIISIPAGHVHAIGSGILLAEVQQNSDTTYRVYDYGRTGRPLHIDKALDVIDFRAGYRPDKYAGMTIHPGKGCSKRIAVANRHFCVEVCQISGEIPENADGSKFFIYSFLEGRGSIVWENGTVEIPCGESVLIPASMGKYELTGDFTALKTYVPDLGIDVIHPLKRDGKSEQELRNCIGGLADENWPDQPS